MSLPYLRIDDVSYSTASNVLSVSLKALRIRGYDSENDIIIEGFSQSKIIPITNGFFEGSVTYSIPNLETSTASTSPTTTYVPASRTWTFAGTASPNNTVRVNSPDFGAVGSNLFIFTFSSTQSVSLAVATLVATASQNATGKWTGFTAEQSGNTFILSAPWGAYNNGLDVVITASGSLTVSPTASQLVGGVTQYNLDFKRSNPALGSLGVNTFNFTVGTYSL